MPKVRDVHPSFNLEAATVWASCTILGYKLIDDRVKVNSNVIQAVNPYETSIDNYKRKKVIGDSLISLVKPSANHVLESHVFCRKDRPSSSIILAAISQSNQGALYHDSITMRELKVSCSIDSWFQSTWFRPCKNTVSASTEVAAWNVTQQLCSNRYCLRV